MRRLPRRSFCSGIGSTVAGLGLVLGSSGAVGADDSTGQQKIEPNDVVVPTTAAPVWHSKTREEISFEAQAGRPARARWSKSIAGERYWRVSFARKLHGWVRAADLTVRDQTFDVGDSVETTNETRVWPSVPSYFQGPEEDIDDVAVGRQGTITRSQFMNWGTVWWRVDWGGGVTGWTPESVLAAEGATRAFEDGELVMATVDLHVRRSPTLYDSPAGESVIGTADRAARGTVVDGYESGAGYNWWKIDWIDALREAPPTGWSVERHLQTVSGVPGSP